MRNFGLQPAAALLTSTQEQCLQIVCEWRDVHGRTPKWRELAAEMELDSAFVAYWTVCEIAQKGWIRIRWAWRPEIVVLRRPTMPDFTEIEWTKAPGAVAANGGRTDA